MFNLTNLKKDRAAEKDAMDALLKKADGEKRMLDAEELKQFDAHEARFNDLTETITRAERALKINIDTPDPNVDNPGQTATRAQAGAQVHDNAEDRPFSGFGEFLQSVRGAVMSPSTIDPRLHKRAAAGANESIGSEGGFLVGKDQAAEILQEMHDVGVLAPQCSPVPISANSNGITINGVNETSRVDGSRWGGVVAYWAAEAGSLSGLGSKPAFRQIELKLKKLHALYYATDEVNADAAALGALASKAFAEEMAFKVDDGIFRGTGAGQLQGILNSGVLVSVDKEAGQAGKTVVYENIVKMYSRMHPRSLPRAKWYINSDVLPQLMLMGIAVGAGGVPVFLPANGASSAPYGTLLGRPIVPVEFCSTCGTVGDIVFADFSQYLLATKGGLERAESMHVQFLTGEMTYRFTYRCDGQTARSTPLTPFKGSNTLSPFVCLAVRA